MTGSGLRLDDQIEALAAGIVERISIDPPGVKERLQPPQLRVVKGPPGINCYCVRAADANKLILLGADLYPFVRHYTRAAAAWFLPDKPGGPSPSSHWPPACAAVATTLDWMSSPASVPVYPDFALTPRQEHVATAFAYYAYRFALCHEMAHVALGHLEEGPLDHRLIDGGDYEVLQLSHRWERDADRFGLDLQFRSLPDSTQIVTGLSSAIYFFHIVGLRNARLMLLTPLVDEYSWKIARTHPPELLRLATLMGTAERLQCGFRDGLTQVHESLHGLDGRLWDAANRQQARVIAAVRKLIDAEVARHTQPLTGKRPSPAVESQSDRPILCTPRTVRTMLRQFDRSPVGVLHALEPPDPGAVTALATEGQRRRWMVVEELATALPSEFQRFRRLTRQERATAIA